MADTPEVLFQTRLDPDLHERFVKQRERWGMTTKELLTRILTDGLPVWEKSKGPPVAAAQ